MRYGCGASEQRLGFDMIQRSTYQKAAATFFTYQWEMEWFKDGNGYFVSFLIKDPVKMLSLDVYRRACSAGLGY